MATAVYLYKHDIECCMMFRSCLEDPLFQVIIDTLQIINYVTNPVPGGNKIFLHLYYEKIKQKFFIFVLKKYWLYLTNTNTSSRYHKNRLIPLILILKCQYITNQNSSNYTHLPMHICKLIHHCNCIHKQNRSGPQIITLNNYIKKQIHGHKTNTWKQHFDKIDHKHNYPIKTTYTTEQKHSLQN